MSAQNTPLTPPAATILVIDDDDPVRESIAEILEVSGYQVYSAINGVQALEQMEQHLPDLIVCDVSMPVMDGYEFLTIVRSTPEWASIPVFFLSAMKQPKDIQIGLDLGATRYIYKPFEVEDLLKAIAAALR